MSPPSKKNIRSQSLEPVNITTVGWIVSPKDMSKSQLLVPVNVTLSGWLADIIMLRISTRGHPAFGGGGEWVGERAVQWLVSL